MTISDSIEKFIVEDVSASSDGDRDYLDSRLGARLRILLPASLIVLGGAIGHVLTPEECSLANHCAGDYIMMGAGLALTPAYLSGVFAEAGLINLYDKYLSRKGKKLEDMAH